MIVLELFIVLALTLLNGLLAMSEMAIVSSRRARLEHMAKGGVAGARRALRLVDDPARLLSTVQIGITLVGILAGAYSGATLADQLGDKLDQFPVLAPYGDRLAIGIVVIGITYLSLIVGELVPKRIAMNNPEKIATLVARPMDYLSRFAAPAVWLLRGSTEAVLRGFGLTQSTAEPVSEEEVKSLIAEGTRTGTFEPQERAMIEGVLRLADRTVRTVMTPRADIYWLDLSDDAAAIAAELEKARYSRLLVCENTVDHPIGTITTKDALAAALKGETLQIRTLMTPAVLVPETMPVLDLIELFKNRRAHMATVVDQHGVTQGLVTTTDILESIAGSLPQREDEPPPGLVQRKDGTWLVDGALAVDEFEDRLGLRGIRKTGDFETVAGFVLHRMQYVPAVGEHFEFNGIRFEVMDLDGRRIDKVLVTLPVEDDTG